MYKNRYVYDALYGRIIFPEFIWEYLHCPELQRLREVRLCNINSLNFTGGANINRYEHSLATAYLALKNLEAWPLGIDDRTHRLIVLAALFHDLGSGAFGHSVQYVLDSKGFEHESVYDMMRSDDIGKGQKYRYQDTRAETIFFGMPRRLQSMLTKDDLREISDLIAGKGEYGPLISGTIDLDNIDNVYRLSYHIGLVRSGDVPFRLACSILANQGSLVIKDSSIPLLQDWFDTRMKLYNYLLLNPDEFSAKCMLQEALDFAQAHGIGNFKWYYVDYELLEKLAKLSDEVSMIVSRLMVGNLYGCIGIFSTNRFEVHDRIIDYKFRCDIEDSLSKFFRDTKISPYSNNPVFRLHSIKDVNKTRRELKLETLAGKTVNIGESSNRILIGVFLKNVNWSMTQLDEETVVRSGIKQLLISELSKLFDINDLQEITLFDESGGK